MKTILSFFVIAASLSCVAQNKDPKNEFGLNLYGLELKVNATIVKVNKAQSVYFSGAQYKRSISEQYNLRFVGQYFTNSTSDAGTLLYQQAIIAGDYGGPFAYNINEEGFETRAGLERTFLKKKIKPFVFADLVYRYINTQTSFLNNGQWQKESSNAYYGGGLCGIGLKYFPIKQLYFSFESSIGYYNRFGRQGYKGYNDVLFSPVKTIVLA